MHSRLLSDTPSSIILKRMTNNPYGPVPSLRGIITNYKALSMNQRVYIKKNIHGWTMGCKDLCSNVSMPVNVLILY